MDKQNIIIMLDNMRQLEQRISLILVDTALTYSQFRLLSILFYSAHPLPGTALSAKLGITKASITAQLKSLSNASLITSQPCKADKRSSLISLSDNGRQRMKVTLENLTALEKLLSPEAKHFFMTKASPFFNDRRR